MQKYLEMCKENPNMARSVIRTLEAAQRYREKKMDLWADDMAVIREELKTETDPARRELLWEELEEITECIREYWSITLRAAQTIYIMKKELGE